MLLFSSFSRLPPDDNAIARESQGSASGAIMRAKYAILSLMIVAALWTTGCAPNDLFWRLDRCYLADWTNHQSCLSCCDDGNCQHR
jgi:hypothetical protein